MKKLENLFNEFDEINSLSKLDELKSKIDEELSKLPQFDSKRRELWEKTYNFHRHQVKAGIKIMALDIQTVFEYFGIINDNNK